MRWFHALSLAFSVSLVRVILKRFFGDFFYTAIGYSLVQIISLGLILVIGVFAFKRDRDLFFKTPPVESNFIFSGIVLTFALCLFCLTLSEIEELLRPGFDDGVRFGWTADMKSRFLSILFVSPIIEELFYRGLLLPALLKRNTKLQSIVIVTSIFLLFHLSLDDVTGIPLFSHLLTVTSFNCMICWLMITYNNIRFCILIHFMWNVFIYVIPILTGLSHLPLNNPLVLCIFFIIVLIGFALAAKVYLKRLGFFQSIK